MEQYYNPKTGLSGVYAMYKGQAKYTLKQVKDMIAQQGSIPATQGQGQDILFSRNRPRKK